MRTYLIIIFSMVCLQVKAHVGSPDIIYEGNAGPYPLTITIRPPDVVPGIARIFIDASGSKTAKLNKVIVQPIYFQYGSNGAPNGDIAQPVTGTQHLFEGKLWLMTFGSSSVKISVEGNKGNGSTIIPVPAVATATRSMDKGTSIMLGIMGIFLLFSIITIIGSAVREATLKHGERATKKRKRAALIVMLVTLFVFSSGLMMANNWWTAVEQTYKRHMFKPLSFAASISNDHLNLEIKNQKWLERKLNDLVPDHGKLMHLFLINTKEESFAHLHPKQIDSAHFSNIVPHLKNGQYQVFAEVVHANGMSETLTDTIKISNQKLIAALEDDAFAGNVPFADLTATTENIHIKSENLDKLKAGIPLKMAFNCSDKEGNPLSLEPYLGMAGHAVVMKDDASVFIHLHPMGTISMAAQYALAGKLNEDVTICGYIDDTTASFLDTTGVVDKQMVSLMRMGSSKSINSGKVVFPYVFPKPGTYFIWIQVKHLGKIETGGFKVKVQ